MRNGIAAFAGLALIGAPAAAQNASMRLWEQTSNIQGTVSPATFTGVQLRLGSKKPRLSIGVAGAFHGSNGQLRISEGLAFTANDRQAAFTIKGTPVKTFDRKLGLSKGATIGLVVAGVLVAGLVVVAATTKPVPDDFLSE